jgi:hypothetical protein
MTKGRAIKLYCLECAGDSANETTLCQIKDCPLWEHRLGGGMRTAGYQNRVKGLWERGGEVVEAARADGQTLDFWLSKAPFTACAGEKASRARGRAGETKTASKKASNRASTAKGEV